MDFNFCQTLPLILQFSSFSLCCAVWVLPASSVSEWVPSSLSQTSWIQCSCPWWILAVGSLQESWLHWQRSLLMSSKHTCSCPLKSTAGQARPLPSFTRWDESLLIGATPALLLVFLPKAQLRWVSCCLYALAVWLLCEHFQKMRGVILWETGWISCQCFSCGPAWEINWKGIVVDGLKAEVSVHSLSFLVIKRLLSLLRLFPAPLEWITREWNLLPNYSCHSQIL